MEYQKFEYISLFIDVIRDDEEKILNKHGLDGWELVGYTRINDSYGVKVLFKRPLFEPKKY